MDPMLIAVGIIGERQLTDELLNEVLGSLAQIRPAFDPASLDQIRKHLEASIGVSMAVGQGLHGGKIAPWVGDVKASTRWDYWNSYVKQLQAKGFNRDVIRVLDDDTDNILTECGNPGEGGAWESKGLVMGDVQSGKTASYCGLISKAADAGYKVIVLLTGVIEELRSQSQERLDEGFVGRDSRELLEGRQAGAALGAGRFRHTLDASGRPVSRTPNVLTSVDSDFLRANHRALGGIPLMNIREPVLLVLKKNRSPLANLISYLQSQLQSGATRLDLPLLVIDDEADNASVNARKDDDPATINRLIRELRTLFSRSSYVGYTATPFANVFINSDIDADLFPSNFIYSLNAPTNYLGVSSFFSPEGSHSQCVIDITDADASLPYGHKSDFEVGDVPLSMKDAVGLFLLSCAVRDLRMEPLRHRSMLVNASRFTAVQGRIAEVLKNFLYAAKEDVAQYLASDERWYQTPLLQWLKGLWDEHYEGCGFTWDEVRAALHDSIATVAVVTVNQDTAAEERLNYSRYAGSRHGRRVIAVGGLTLSRGLTLEGLCISYFYRNSKAYDTLLQMGRWFGYRLGYDDLCRVWVDPDAADWYAHLAEVVDELRADIRRMHANQLPPSQFGMRVRSHPGALIVTAPTKMRNAREIPVRLSYSGFGGETPLLPDDVARNSENLSMLAEFVAELDYGQPQWEGGRKVWTGVAKGRIAAFLEKLHILDLNVPFMRDITGRVRPLTEFIARNDLPELETWDVSLPQGDGDSLAALQLRGPDGSTQAIRPRVRQFEKVPPGSDFLRLNRQRVGDTSDELVGLAEAQREKAREDWAKQDTSRGKSVPAYFFRRYRDRPLLTVHVIQPGESKPRDGKSPRKPMMHPDAIEPRAVVAIGISFPLFDGDEMKTTVPYTLNRVALRAAGLISEDEDDAD